MAQRLNREDFKEQIRSGRSLSIIEFYSDSCVPCKRMAPLLAEVEERNPEVFVGKVNVAWEPELAGELDVTSTPTLLFYRNGEELARTTGAVRRNFLEETIERYLS